MGRRSQEKDEKLFQDVDIVYAKAQRHERAWCVLGTLIVQYLIGSGKKRSWRGGLGCQHEGHWVSRLGLGFYPGEHRQFLSGFKQRSDMILFCFSGRSFWRSVWRTDIREQDWKQEDHVGDYQTSGEMVSEQRWQLVGQRRKNGLDRTQGTGWIWHGGSGEGNE